MNRNTPRRVSVERERPVSIAPAACASGVSRYGERWLFCYVDPVRGADHSYVLLAAPADGQPDVPRAPRRGTRSRAEQYGRQ